MLRTGVVVLAAGGGTRFLGPGHKLAAPLSAEVTVAGRAASTALAASIGPVAVVVGAASARSLSLPDGVTVVVNERWAEGQATSLATAVAWARAQGLNELVVGLGDQPGLAPGAWRAVARERETPISVARYGERRGHPVRFAAEVWDLFPTEGDAGHHRAGRPPPASLPHRPRHRRPHPRGDRRRGVC